MIEIRTGTALQHAAALQHLRTKLIGWEKVAGSLPISIPLRKVAGPKLHPHHQRHSNKMAFVVVLSRQLPEPLLHCCASKYCAKHRTKSTSVQEKADESKQRMRFFLGLLSIFAEI